MEHWECVAIADHIANTSGTWTYQEMFLFRIVIVSFNFDRTHVCIAVPLPFDVRNKVFKN